MAIDLGKPGLTAQLQAQLQGSGRAVSGAGSRAGSTQTTRAQTAQVRSENLNSDISRTSGSERSTPARPSSGRVNTGLQGFEENGAKRARLPVKVSSEQEIKSASDRVDSLLRREAPAGRLSAQEEAAAPVRLGQVINILV